MWPHLPGSLSCILGWEACSLWFWCFSSLYKTIKYSFSEPENGFSAMCQEIHPRWWNMWGKNNQLINWGLQQCWHGLPDKLPNGNKHDKNTVKPWELWKHGVQHFHALFLHEEIHWYFFLRRIFCLSVTPFYPVLINGEGNAAEKGKKTIVEEVR